ncbi:hypothetical protein G647_09042 [Cladophialophora carrionii CBS 160.54]|uniref:Apple domain-containing protein n=1 Tax=Cladophialophora carrionii CBS 160.54 TaxID=1279043 RepID=V9D213_9EURO|nr:uncharacterized protein G647_09042 [Cladophialophora carrionii CBS 160.54]ETI20027.1 hypothetical protein G647_09042 [Cladophialophora carrionii CBS 160.54]
MASLPSTNARSSYSDKQVVSSVDHGKEVVATAQPYPDAYAYANPNNTNNDGSTGGEGDGGLEVVHPLFASDKATPAWSEQNPKRRICGLSRKNFIIVIAVATALAVAAIIGGSVGGVLASRNSSGGSQADAVEVRWICSLLTRTDGVLISPALKSSSMSAAITQTTATSTSTTPTTASTTESVTATTVSSSSVPTSATSTSTSSAATPTSSEGSYNCPSDNNKSYVSSLLSTATWTILCDTDWPLGVDSFSGGTVADITAVVAYSIESCIDQCAAYNVAGGPCEAVVYGANITLALSRGGVQGNCFLKTDRGAENFSDNSGQVEAAYLSS